MLLTDEEIYATWGAAKNEAYSFREFARAIESAVLEKLKAQEPEKWTPAGFCDDGEPLYRHPLPPDDVVRDAERYRWLRKKESWIPNRNDLPAPFCGAVKWIGGAYSENEIDDLIDYAMKEMK